MNNSHKHEIHVKTNNNFCETGTFNFATLWRCVDNFTGFKSCECRGLRTLPHFVVPER